MDIKWEMLAYGIAGGFAAIVINQTLKNKAILPAGVEGWAP